MLFAGAVTLHDLPQHLLYHITQDLDLSTQRKLFLCSSQLYSMWKLQVPDHNFLEAAALNRLCDSNSLIKLVVDFDKFTHCNIHTYLNSEHSPVFTLSRMVAMTTADQAWSGMTKDQLWHRLSAAPDLRSASLSWVSHAQLMPVSDPLKVATRQIFDLLCTTDGLLSISMSGLEDASEMEGHGLNGCHCVDEQGFSVWTKDGKTCIAEPPDITFDDMPTGFAVVYIVARLYTRLPSLLHLFIAFNGC